MCTVSPISYRGCGCIRTSVSSYCNNSTNDVNGNKSLCSNVTRLGSTRRAGNCSICNSRLSADSKWS